MYIIGETGRGVRSTPLRRSVARSHDSWHFSHQTWQLSVWAHILIAPGSQAGRPTRHALTTAACNRDLSVQLATVAHKNRETTPMSRLAQLLRQARKASPQMGQDLGKKVAVRHRDKVRVLLPRGVATPGKALSFFSVLLLGTLPLAGCFSWEERTCSEGEYPVKPADGSPGGHCLPNGQPPGPGFTTYPPGQTPTIYSPK